MAGNVTALAESIAELQAHLATLQADHNEALDTIWMIMAGLLVVFMHAGFSILESGNVRFKNTQNILAKNMIVTTVGFLCWYAVGWSFALGPVATPNKFMGGTDFFMAGFWDDKTKLRIWYFQGAFCATGATIVSGAMAERTQLKGFFPYVMLMTSLIYPVVVYWCWGGKGFLNYLDEAGKPSSIVGPPFKDFAGSGVVHLVGGVASICGALIVGPRTGRWDAEKAEEFDGHSIPFCVLGTFFLWFGWYGFNCGSTGTMHDAATAYTAGLVAVNTTIAPCVAGLLVFFLRAKVVEPKRLDVGGFCNGVLAGLVAITAGCACVKPWESVIIGFIGGLVYQGLSMLLRRLRVDDVVDAVPVHGGCGLWGVLAVGFFGDPAQGMGGNGVFYGGDQLGVQVLGIILIALWSGTLSIAIFLPMRLLGMLRLSDSFQEAGADAMEHSPSKAYGGNSDASPKASQNRPHAWLG